MRLWCKYIRNYLLVYQLISHFLPYLRNYKEFEGEILDLQLEKYGLSFETKKYTTSGWARGDENVIGIRAFKSCFEKFLGTGLIKWTVYVAHILITGITAGALLEAYPPKGKKKTKKKTKRKKLKEFTKKFLKNVTERS